MPIRLSGLSSGLDTEALVTELVKAYSKKTEKYEKEQTKLSWKQDIWKGLNTKVYSLYTNISNLRYDSAYNVKKTTVSDATKATVKASSSAPNVTQKLNILSVAQTAYLTGGQLAKGTKASDNLANIGYKGEDGKIQITNSEGEVSEVEIKRTSKISDVVDELKKAGLNANYDEDNRRIYVTSKVSGEAGDFSIVGLDENGREALKSLGINVALTTEDADGNTVFTGAAASYKKLLDNYYVAGEGDVTDFDATKAKIMEQISAYDALKAQYDALKAPSLEMAEANKEKQAKIDANQKIIDASKAKTALEEAGVDLADLEEGVLTDEEMMEKYSIPKGDVAIYREKAQMIREVEESDPDWNWDDVNLTTLTGENETLKDEIKANEDAIKEYDEAHAEELADLSKQMKANPLAELASIEGEERRNAEISNFVHRVLDAKAILDDPYSKTGSASKINGADAKITLNGVDYTSSNNVFSVNGLTITANAVTGEGEENAITITTNTDTQGLYDKIKDFLTEYNAVINEITKLYNAASAKDYEPLTDEEKDAMSDTEVEKWETKIKDSLLRRDNTLGSLMNVMTTAMMTSFTIKDQKLSLSSFGINTLGYFNSAENENYAYHIDGDEDDENVSGKEDRLMKMIGNDPDTVIDFMKQLTSTLYTAIDGKMKSTSLSSAYKVYNDKEMDKQYAEYTKTISKWEEKISQKEDYYYKKFTAMEKAMSKMDSQTNSLAGLLGN